MRTLSRSIAVAAMCLSLIVLPGFSGDLETIKNSGTTAGVVVHVGCGDGVKTASWRINGNFLVQGLDSSAANIEAARKHLQEKKLYGPVSVKHWDGGALPYNDNLVNFLVVDDPRVSEKEALRVLVPGGRAIMGGKILTKKIPEGSDGWSHSLYDASGNPVSRDKLVGPPRHLQWFVPPKFGRQHEHMSSFTSMVSSGGKVFYIVDEGSGVSVILPPAWKLIARDAYNGMKCWERPIDTWFSRFYPMKSGPFILSRLIVAIEEKVFATLNVGDPISLLDAATGNTLKTYDQTRGTWEFIVSDGILVASASKDGKFMEYKRSNLHMIVERDTLQKRKGNRDARRIMAIEVESGKTLWEIESKNSESSLCTDGHSLVFNDYENLVCLDLKTGKEKWKTPVQQKDYYKTGESSTTLIVDGVVMFGGMTGKAVAYDVRTGEKMWEAPQPRTGHFAAYDLFVVNGQVWSGQTASGRSPGEFVGVNLKTGQKEQSFTMKEEPYWWHHRCHRNRATQNWLITSRTGIELIDFRNETYDANHWVRGACAYGIMPSYGLLYAPPHPCACYMSTQMNHFNALVSPERVTYAEPARDAAQRLVKGPAYDKPIGDRLPGEWPQYRHDAARSGVTDAEVKPEVKEAWKVSLGGKLSGCTIEGGKVFVAAVDQHTVHALDEETGNPVWKFTAEARVDSPPACVLGRVVFGSADGSVYCLSAATGEVAWRYDLAPEKRQMIALGQFESPWPVSGSVLVRGSTAYCLAGRSRFLDGGLTLALLDVRTGALGGRKDYDEKGMLERVKGLSMPVAQSGIMSANEKHLFLHFMVMDFEGNVVLPPAPEPKRGRGAVSKAADEQNHLFCPTGLLDDSWFHRTYWIWGREFGSGWGGWHQQGRVVPAGRILSHSEKDVYGFGRIQDNYLVNTPLEYHIFKLDKSAPKKISKEAPEPCYPGVKKWGYPSKAKQHYQWTHPSGLYATAMVLTKNVMFLAGPRKTLDERKAWEGVYEPSTQKDLRMQLELLEGAEGSVLQAISEKTGEKLYECAIPSVPTWDGMAAAKGKLFMTTRDGQVICFEGR